MGEHKMQPVTGIIKTIILLNERIGHKFKINTIPVAGNAVADNPHAVAFPAMDPVSGLDFIGSIGVQLVTDYAAII
jgi:hypothetical protein